jgi:NAD(P)-dependent dehydrogenase (short-subunit alcohol dehydrogenase family)
MANFKQDMQGKKVLVTGAGTGIGRGVAMEFAREGADVVLHYSRSDAGARSAVEEIRKAGGKAEAYHADFTDMKQVRELADKAIAFLGGLDVLVNNSGITMNRQFERVTEEQFDTLFSVNIKAMFFLAQAVLPAMLKQGEGVIINMTSGHAFGGAREHAVYAATKGAIVSFTRSLAVELAPRGIRVNAIAPGWVLVENQVEVFGEGFDEAKASQVLPAGFIARAADLGRVAVFLASKEAKYFFGQTLICDGGQNALMAAIGDFRTPFQQTFGKKYVPGL